jgi:hypothetical protein
LEIAAITMAGWRYPVGTELLRKSYRLAYGVDNTERQAIRLVDYDKKTGVRVFTAELRQMREHGQVRGMKADELAAELIGSALGFMHGVAPRAQLQKLVAAANPRFDGVSESALAWTVELMTLRKIANRSHLMVRTRDLLRRIATKSTTACCQWPSAHACWTHESRV